MPTPRPFTPIDPRRGPALPPPGRPGRLTLAAAVLGEVRAFAAACRTGPLQRPPALRASALEAAVLAYEDGRWVDAFAATAAGADAGDPCAAKLALLMLRHGAGLYGTAFSAEPRRIAHWALRVLDFTAVGTGSPDAASVGRSPPASDRGGRPDAGSPPQRDPRSTSRLTASPSSITAIA